MPNTRFGADDILRRASSSGRIISPTASSNRRVPGSPRKRREFCRTSHLAPPLVESRNQFDTRGCGSIRAASIFCGREGCVPFHQGRRILLREWRTFWRCHRAFPRLETDCL